MTASPDQVGLLYRISGGVRAYGEDPGRIIERGTAFGLIVTSLSGPTVPHVAITDMHFLAAQRDWTRRDFVVSFRQDA